MSDEIKDMTLEDTIKTLEDTIKLEKFKSSLYRKIIEANTNIIIPDNNGDIVEQFNELQKLFKMAIIKKPIQENKSSYKIFKNMELADEPSIDEQNSKIFDKYIYENDDGFTVAEANKIFEQSFRDIEKSKVFTKILENIKNTRTKLVSITIDEYANMIKEHMDKLNKIFLEKGLSEKTIMKNITTSLSPLDLRIVSYPPYINTKLAMDDIARYKKHIIYSLNFSKKYVPFNYDDTFKSFYNYGTVICTLGECIERNLFNIYGYNNLVYIQIPKSTDADPFSFYHLKKIENKKRYWNMDCRLEDLSNKFIDNIRPYLIDVFRKIYFDIFCDNDYRPNFLAKTDQADTDIKQITQSICLLCNPKKFNKFLRNIVKTNATYKVTSNDIKNLSADDSSQRRRFENEKEKIDPVETMKILFDNISSEEAVDYYRSVNSYV